MAFFIMKDAIFISRCFAPRCPNNQMLTMKKWFYGRIDEI
jgi:hypothetical protein